MADIFFKVLAFILLCVCAVAGILVLVGLHMAVWGLIFWCVDYVIPGLFVPLIGQSMAPFTLGALLGLLALPLTSSVRRA